MSANCDIIVFFPILTLGIENLFNSNNFFALQKLNTKLKNLYSSHTIALSKGAIFAKKC